MSPTVNTPTAHLPFLTLMLSRRVFIGFLCANVSAWLHWQRFV